MTALSQFSSCRVRQIRELGELRAVEGLSALLAALSCSIVSASAQTSPINPTEQEKAIQAWVREATRPFPTDADMILMLHNNIGCFEDMLRMSKHIEGPWYLELDIN